MSEVHVWNGSWVEYDEFGMILAWDMNEGGYKCWHEIGMHDKFILGW